MIPGKLGTASKLQRPAVAAELIRNDLNSFCSDTKALEEFYNMELSQLPPAPEEVPLLKI